MLCTPCQLVVRPINEALVGVSGGVSSVLTVCCCWCTASHSHLTSSYSCWPFYRWWRSMKQWKKVGFVVVCSEVSCTKMALKVDLSGPKGFLMPAHTTLTRLFLFRFLWTLKNSILLLWIKNKQRCLEWSHEILFSRFFLYWFYLLTFI